jgi:Tfp pilus assembly protein FimT
MVLACLAVAMVAPSLSGWSRGAQLRDAADQFVSMTRLARSRAVAEGITYRLNVDAQAEQYQLMVQNGENFVPLQSSWGTARTLPESVQMKFQSASNGAAAQSYIDFSPTGRAEPATITFTSSRGQTLTVDCPSPAEGFVVEQAGGGAR